VAVAVATVLAGCAGGPVGGSGDAASGDGSTAADTLAQVLGPDVESREDGSFGLDRWSQASESAADGSGPPGRVVRVSYPAGSVSPSASREYGVPGGGMQVFAPLVDGPLEEAHLRYWVRFPAGFEFVKGGKLPGLFGGTEVSGGEEPDGTDGFSTRLMWRTAGEGEVYLYAPGESGTSLGRGSWTWPTDRWVCVEQRVTLNDPEEDDGSVTVWLDGREVFTESDIEYRTTADLQIEGLFFSTFYGGDDPSWAPSQDQHADFAGFAVSAEPVGCSS
jgi:hypothetical protein